MYVIMNRISKGKSMDLDYELVYKVKEKLLNELNSKTNSAMNIDYMKYLENF